MRTTKATPAGPSLITALDTFFPQVLMTWHTQAAVLLRRAVDFLPFLTEGDSYGSRRRGFCFIADCPPGVFR